MSAQSQLFILGFIWLAILSTGVVLLLMRLLRLDQVVEHLQEGGAVLLQRPVRWWMVGVVVLGGCAAFGVSWGVVSLAGKRGDGLQEANLMWIVGQTVFGYVVFLGMLMHIRGRVEGGLSALFFSTERESAQNLVGRGMMYYVMSAPWIFASAALYYQVLQWLGMPLEQQPMMELLSAVESPWLMAGMALFAVVLAPIAEEFLFRGLILPLLMRQAGLVGGVLLTSLGFAFLHGHTQTLFPLMVVSVFFSLGYVFGKNIWVPIVMHGCFNGLSLLSLILQKGLS